MESRGPEDSKNVKISQAYFFEGFISFFEDFSLTTIHIYTFDFFLYVMMKCHINCIEFLKLHLLCFYDT